MRAGSQGVATGKLQPPEAHNKQVDHNSQRTAVMRLRCQGGRGRSRSSGSPAGPAPPSSPVLPMRRVVPAGPQPLAAVVDRVVAHAAVPDLRQGPWAAGARWCSAREPSRPPDEGLALQEAARIGPRAGPDHCWRQCPRRYAVLSWRPQHRGPARGPAPPCEGGPPHLLLVSEARLPVEWAGWPAAVGRHVLRSPAVPLFVGQAAEARRRGSQGPQGSIRRDAQAAALPLEADQEQDLDRAMQQGARLGGVMQGWSGLEPRTGGPGRGWFRRCRGGGQKREIVFYCSFVDARAQQIVRQCMHKRCPAVCPAGGDGGRPHTCAAPATSHTAALNFGFSTCVKTAGRRSGDRASYLTTTAPCIVRQSVKRPNN